MRGLKGRKTFFRKTNPSNLYKWTPFDGDKKRRKKSKISGDIEFCNATPGSQGIDNNVTYVYKQSISGHLAYVECDYVE